MSSYAIRRLGRTAALVAALAALPACRGERAEAAEGAQAARDEAVRVVDDAGRTVTLPRPARRIVALMPSATETILALGAGDRLVGRTDFDEGMGIDSLPSVGEGLSPNLEALVALRPDLVLTWETAEKAELRTRLEGLGIPVFAVNTDDTTDVFRAVANLGRLVGRTQAADSLAASMRAELEAVRASVAGRARPSVFYVVWNDPPMTASPSTFIGQVIEAAGGTSAFADAREQWPTVSMEEIVRRQPGVLVVPTGEAGAAKLDELRGAPGWRELEALKTGRAVTVPGVLMNRPGPRLGEAARVMRDAIHGPPAPR